MRICDGMSSARASAIDLRTVGLSGGGTGMAAAKDDGACDAGEEINSCGAARALLSDSSRLYQHWRLLGCSVR